MSIQIQIIKKKSKDGDAVERYKKRNKEAGQALVEWALVFPVFFLLLCAIIDFGWLGYQQLMFESSLQMTAWDFPLKIQHSSGDKEVSSEDVFNDNMPPKYNTSYPGNVVEVNGKHYSLGEGIRHHVLQRAAGFLKMDELAVTKASATFKRREVEDYYEIGGNQIRQESYLLMVDLKGEIEYRVSLLTPISRAFIPAGEVVFRKSLIRERTERVVTKRQVILPPKRI